MGDERLDQALELAAAHARDQQRRLATAERLLAAEREERRGDLERVLVALGQETRPDGDVRVLARLAVDAAGRLRASNESLRDDVQRLRSGT